MRGVGWVPLPSQQAQAALADQRFDAVFVTRAHDGDGLATNRRDGRIDSRPCDRADGGRNLLAHRRDGRFVDERDHRVVVFEQVGLEHLQRDFSPQRFIAHAKHAGHSALPEKPELGDVPARGNRLIQAVWIIFLPEHAASRVTGLRQERPLRRVLRLR